MNGSDGATTAPPATTNGTAAPPPPPIKRRVKKMITNPFATARQPGQMTRPNGLPMPPPKPNGVPPMPKKPAGPTAPTVRPDSVSGFSDPAVTAQGKKYTDFKLVATKKDLLDGLRFHLMHLTGEKMVDIRDAKQFPQPAHLHRRDPRAEAAGVAKEEQAELKDGLNAEEREALKIKNELRKQERAANLAQIAPTQSARKAANQKTKTKAVIKRDFTEDDKRRIQTNYEEKLPWVLEDFDSKHAFIGENQPSAQNRHVAFVFERGVDPQTGKFRLVPVEKVYDFKRKRVVKNELTVDEAEAVMKKKAAMPFFMEQQRREKQIKAQRELLSRPQKLFVGENKTNKYAGRTGDEADWDNDDEGGLFADDEEGDVIRDVKDEDEALAEKRIKEDQLKANFFDVKEEQEYDQEEAEEEKEEQERKQYSRGYRKLLEKHEHNYNHASDSEYSSSSDEEDEEERARADAEKRANLEAMQNQLQLPSGATTPSGRKEKSGLYSDREGSKSKRKRPGSPYLSEGGSGTDTSTRNKKPKTRHPSSTNPLSRPDTPVGQAARIRVGAGSDTDGGTMSDSTARKLKLKHSNRPGSISSMPSRSGSPAPGTTSLPSRSGAASPPAAATKMPSLDDIRTVISNSMPEGLTLQAFIKAVPHPKAHQKEFVALTLRIAKFEKRGDDRKVLVLKDGNSDSNKTS